MYCTVGTFAGGKKGLREKADGSVVADHIERTF